MREVKRKEKPRWMTEETLKLRKGQEAKVTGDNSRVRLLNADFL